jgi:hypothetical protein
MATFNKEIEVKIGDDGLIVLRQPTNKEYNEFEAARYPVKRNVIKDHAREARVAFFDLLLVRVEKIEDEQGAITVEEKHRIPERYKTRIVFNAFESNEEIEVKN